MSSNTALTHTQSPEIRPGDSTLRSDQETRVRPLTQHSLTLRPEIRPGDS
ncbi:uncharacterized, partial [Tachysurus ichikawai]